MGTSIASKLVGSLNLIFSDFLKSQNPAASRFSSTAPSISTAPSVTIKYTPFPLDFSR